MISIADIIILQFSIIILTIDRPKQLAIYLKSFKALKYRQETWELIVVTDAGASSFDGITEELKQSLPMRLVTIEIAWPGAARIIS